jgi:hypothetical protein
MLLHLRFASALAIGVAALCSTTAQAADNTRYISITGNNANACTLAAPCRTMHKGISVTPAGGELQILDSGFYGNNATVNKSMTVSGNGHTVYLGTTMTVDNAQAVVALRGLKLDGQGTVADGIRIIAAAAVHIERCLVHGFTDQGIRAGVSDVEVFLVDTTVRDNGLFGFNGESASRVTIENSHFHSNTSAGVVTGSANTSIHRSTASGNSSGIFVTAGSTTSVTSTAAVQNASSGFSVHTGATLTIDSSIAHGTGGQGLFVSTESTARISNSTFTNNVTGIQINSGIVETRSNNTIEGNTTDVIGTLTPITGK